MGLLLGIFLNVLAPVFLLVLLGYLSGPRLLLDSRTMSRFAYYILTPAFTFDVLSKARIEAALAARMTIYIIVVQLLCAALGLIAARLLRRSADMTAAYVLIAVFANVGNFGLPIIQFQFPRDDQVLVLATVYFLAILVVSFVVGVAAANWHRGGSLKAAIAVFKTPALIVVPPALIINWLGFEPPSLVSRPVALLAGALIPTMLVALGVQLANAGVPRPDLDMLISSAIRLVAGPILAIGLAAPFGLVGIEGSIGIIQASMPAAVLASIIAVENDLLPTFVIATVLFSTLASMVTLTIVLAIL
jgi:malate permease and related proteins